MYLQEVMLVSLGATVDNISDQRIYYLVNDKKISLLCYQFFKKFTFECKCSSVFISLSLEVSQSFLSTFFRGIVRTLLNIKDGAFCKNSFILDVSQGFEYVSVLTEADVYVYFIENLVIKTLWRKAKKELIFEQTQ